MREGAPQAFSRWAANSAASGCFAPSQAVGRRFLGARGGFEITVARLEIGRARFDNEV